MKAHKLADAAAITLAAVVVVAGTAGASALGATRTEATASAIPAPSTTANQGYRLVGADGSVWAFGGAHYDGEVGGTLIWPVGAAAPNGKGYWLVTENGGVLAFGDTLNYGTAKTNTLMDPVTGLWNWVVGIVSTPDGRGYWLADAAGHVFAFGDAHNYGSLPNGHLPYPLDEAPGPVTGILPA